MYSEIQMLTIYMLNYIDKSIFSTAALFGMVQCVPDLNQSCRL